MISCNKNNTFMNSRQDFYFGDDHTFNQTTFDQTRSHWRDTMIDVQSAARARLARVHTSNATNPTFSLEGDSLSLSYGESAAYLLVFGNKSDGAVKKAYIEYLFGKYRRKSDLLMVACDAETYVWNHRK